MIRPVSIEVAAGLIEEVGIEYHFGAGAEFAAVIGLEDQKAAVLTVTATVTVTVAVAAAAENPRVAGGQSAVAGCLQQQWQVKTKKVLLALNVSSQTGASSYHFIHSIIQM